MTFNELGDTSYMALETFKKNGQGVVTPVWGPNICPHFVVVLLLSNSV